MLNLNDSKYTGNITRQPELRYTQSGLACLSFGLAINTSYQKDGQWVDKTCFIDVSTFGKTAERLNNVLKKGMHVFVQARLDQETWVDKNTGQNRSRHVLKADRIVPTQKQQKQDSYGGDNIPPRGEPTHAPNAVPEPPEFSTEVSDDIPF